MLVRIATDDGEHWRLGRTFFSVGLPGSDTPAARVQAALEYAYVMRYLKRHLPPEAIQDQVLAVSSGDDFLDVEAVVVPERLKLPGPLRLDNSPLPQDEAAPNLTPLQPAAPSAPSTTSAPAVRRFVVPRRIA